jgi:hypothetical protein
MTFEGAKAVCAKYGSSLESYSIARFARIRLVSGEVLLVSIAPTSVNILTKRGFFGWFVPRSIGSKNLSVWVPGFDQLARLERAAARAMILDGLVSLVARCRSIQELAMAWISLRNPMEAAHEDCGWYP